MALKIRVVSFLFRLVFLRQQRKHGGDGGESPSRTARDLRLLNLDNPGRGKILEGKEKRGRRKCRIIQIHACMQILSTLSTVYFVELSLLILSPCLALALALAALYVNSVSLRMP
jgi:hypothetical protein